MRTVYKYDYDKVPIEAIIRHIDYDPKVYGIQVWAEISTQRELSGNFRNIRLHSTGYEWKMQKLQESNLSTPRYLRSVVYPSGLVYHLYDYEGYVDERI